MIILEKLERLSTDNSKLKIVMDEIVAVEGLHIFQTKCVEKIESACEKRGSSAIYSVAATFLALGVLYGRNEHLQ